MDFYCERTNEQVFNEPINAISNIFFIIVSLSLIKILRRNKSEKIYFVQPILIFFIGVGSFLFHLTPNLITLYSDIIPIFLFSLSFIFHLYISPIYVSYISFSYLCPSSIYLSYIFLLNLFFIFSYI